MLANAALRSQSKYGKILYASIIFLIITLIWSSRSLAGIMVNPDQEIGIQKNTSALSLDDRRMGDHAALATAPGLMLDASDADVRVRWTARRIVKEAGKQAVDQPGHFLIGAGPIWASRCLAGVPWFGWVLAPILAYREWLQWPSNRWWDPPLDWTFLSIGAVAATWRGRPGHRLAVIRQRRASAVAARGGMRSAGGRPGAQCSSNSRMPPMTRRMPTTSVRFGRSRKKNTAAANVNTSSIWPRART